MIRLIVNADDYGLTPGVGLGTRQAHREGIVTTATAMMNMPYAAVELQRAHEEVPTLGLGVHLTLTAGVAALVRTIRLQPAGLFRRVPASTRIHLTPRESAYGGSRA